MSDAKDFYLLLNNEERGPFDRATIERMLGDGILAGTDRGWRQGMADWATVEEALQWQAAPAPAPAAVPAEPATAKQKAFLSYMGLPFSAEIGKAEAALLVNEAMENPGDPKRLARWSEDRLRLHPDIFASELQARRENRPNHYYEQVLSQGAECFHEVSRAHCQVLVSYLDVKFPNWDARETEAVWDYFFPAVAEKFPQLVNKAWKGRLQYPKGPRTSPARQESAPRPSPTRRLPARAEGSGSSIPWLLGLVLLGGAGYFLSQYGASTSAPAPGAGGGTPTPQVAGAATNKAGQAPPPATGAAEKSSPEEGEDEKAPGGGGAMAPGEGMASAPEDAGVPPPASFTPPEGEAAGSQPASPPPATAGKAPATPKPVLLTKAVSVQLPYGRVNLPPGTPLKVISQDGVTVRVNYMNSVVMIPVTSTSLGAGTGTL